MKTNRTRRLIQAATASLALSLAGIASAASYFWDGFDTTADADGGNGSWSTANSWDDLATAGSNLTWADGNDAFFGGTAGIVQFSGPVSANTLTFSHSTGSYSLKSDTTTARALTLAVGLTSGAGAVTLGDATNQLNITLSGPQTWSIGAGGVTVANAMAINGLLTKSGGGTLTLGGGNTGSGGIAVSLGTVAGNVASTTNTFGAGNAISVGSGAVLTINDTETALNASTNIANVFSGAGTINLVFAAGTNARNSSFTATNALNSFTGTMQLSAAGSTGDKFSGYTGTTAAALVINSGAQLFAGAGATFSGGITMIGTGNSETRGAIRLGNTLNGNVTLAGDATIGTEGGTLNGNITSGAVGTQTLTLGTVNSTGNATLGGSIGGGLGTISITKTQAGMVTLSGANTYSGGTTISAGSIKLGTSSALGSGAVTISTTGNAVIDATLILGSQTISNAITLTNPGAAANIGFNIKAGAGNVVTLDGVISGGGGNTTLFLNTDTGGDALGRYILNKANTYSGATLINRGSVYLGNGAAFGTSIVNFFGNTGSTLGFNSAMTVANAISYTTAGEKIDTNGFDVTLSGVQTFTAAGTIKTGAGTLTLTAANTGAGGVTVSAGTLALSGANGSILASAPTITGGATLKLDNTAAANSTSRLGDSLAVNMTGGTLLFSNDAVDTIAYAESTGALTITSGANTVSSAQAASDGTSELTFSSLSRTGGTVNFSGTGLGVDTRNVIKITGYTPGLMPAWVTVNGGGFANYDTTLGVQESAYEDVPFGGVIPDDYTKNIRLSGGDPLDGDVTLATDPVSVNAILQNQTDATTIDNQGQILRLGAAGGIALPSGMGSLTIGLVGDTDTLTAGGAPDTAGTVTLTNNDATALLTINSTIDFNGTGVVGVATAGTGKVVLAGLNYYTGTTVLGAAITEISGATQTLSGAISGSGILLKTNAASTLTLSGPNTYTGATNVNAGTLKLGNNAGLGSSSLVTVASGATLNLAGFGSGRAVEISGTGAGSVGALYSSSTTTGASVGSLKLNANATIASAVPGADTGKMVSTGTLNLNGNTLTISGGVFNTGIRDITSGNIIISSGGTLYSVNGGSQTSVTGTITINSGGRMETRDTDNTAMTSLHTIALNGGTLSRGQITGNNGGGAGTTLKNNITVDDTNGGTIRNESSGGWPTLYRLTGSLSGSGALGIQGSWVEFRGDASGYTGAATVSSGTTLNFNGSTANSFNGGLAGAGTVRKENTNTLTLAGNSSHTGATNLLAGTLVLSGSNATSTSAFNLSGGTTLKLDYGSNDNRKIGSGVLTLSGGTIELAGGTFADSVASTTLTASTNSTITRSSGAATLGLNAITRNSGAFLNFAQGGIATTDNLNNASGIIGTWATVGGTDWAVNSTNAADGLITASTYTLTSVALDDADNYTDAHMSVDSNQTPDAAITPFTLRFNNAGAYTLTLTGASTIKAGGILVTTNVGDFASALTGGILQTGTAGGDFAVVQNNAANILTIGSVIQNNTSASTLTKSGAGTLALTGINTYTGATTILGGTLQIGGAGQLATGAYAGAIGNTGTLRYSSSAAQTLSGIISGAGTLVKDTAASTLLLNGASTYTGTTTISTGTVQVGDGTNNTATLGNNSTAAISSGATLAFYRNGTFTIGNAISGAGTLSFLGTGVSTQSDYLISGTNTMTGAITVGSGARLGLDNATDVGTASGITVASGGQAFVSGGTIARPFTIAGLGWTEAAGQLGALRFAGGSTVSGGVTLAGDARLTAYSSGDTGTISGVINDGASTFGLTKTGAGTLTLTNANTYDGVTTLSNGRVNIQNAASLGTGAVIIGDASSGSNAISLYLDTNRVNFSRAITVTSNGTGTVTLGSMSTVTGAADNNQFTSITLQRDVTFDSNAADRTDYENVSGFGNITVSGAQRSVFITNNSYVGNLTIRTSTDANNLQLGTITAAVNAMYDLGSVQIDSGGKLTLSYTSGGSETIGALTGAGNVRMNNSAGNTNTLIVGNGNGSGTFTGVIGGGSGILAITKVGTGTQTLTGANTHTGATSISSGTLALDFSATGAPVTNILNTTANSSSLSMGGGTLLLTGKASTTNSQRVNGLTVAGGSNTIQLAANVTANPLVLTLGAISRTAGTVDFILPTGTQSATNGITTTSSNDASGILGVWATVNGTDLATVSSGNIVAYTAYTDVDALAGGAAPNITDGPTTNVRIFNDGVSGNIGLVPAISTTIATVNTLTMGNATNASTVDTASKTLVTSAVIVGSGKQALTLGAAANDGFLQVNAGGGTLTLNNQSATNALTVNAVIQNNTTASGLIKTGGGLLTLAGTNTYTGVTTIGGGVLATGLLANGGSDSGIGASSNVAANLVLANGTLRYTGNTVSTNRAFTISAGTTGTVDVATSGQELTVSGVIAATTGSLVKTGAGILKLTAVNTYTGTTTVNNGILRAHAGNTTAGAIGNSSAVIVNNGGTIEVGGDNSFTGSTSTLTKTLTINSGGTVTNTGSSTNHLNAIVLNGGTLSATTANGTYGNWNFDQKVSTPGNGSTSTISGGNATLSQVGGTVFDIGATDTVNVSTALAKVSGATDLGLIKQGAGTLNLTGVNTYLSNTTISAGTLKIGAAGQLNSGSYAGTIANSGSLIYSSSAAQTLSGVISGTGSLTKDTGADVLTLGGTNTYTGATTVSAGTLKVSNTSGMGTGTALTLGGGTLQLATDTAVGTKNLTVAGSSAITLDRATAGAGYTTTFGNITFSDTYTLTVAKGANVTSGTATLNFTGFPALGAAGKTAGFDIGTGAEVNLLGNLSGTQAFAKVSKAGLGTLILSGTNDWWDPASSTGLVTISGGTLELRNDRALGDGGTGVNSIALSMAAETTVRVAADTAQVNNADLTLTGSNVTVIADRATTGAGITNQFDVLSIGAHTLNVTGGTNVTSGTTQINFYSATLTGNATFNVTNPAAGGTNLLVSGVVGGAFSLTKNGNGTLTLNGANTYSGGTSVNAGTLQVGNATATNGKVTLNGGNLLVTSGVNYYVDGGMTFASNTNATVASASGTASIYGWDVNNADIIVNSGITGTVNSTVNIAGNGYGFRMDLTGNLNFAGAFTGNTGNAMGQWGQSATPVGTDKWLLFKRGAGTLTLTGASTGTVTGGNASFSIEQGDLVLSGGDNRLPTSSAVYLGGTLNQNARLVLGGINQSLSGLQSAGTGTLAVVANSATVSTLTVNNTNNYTFAGKIGGTGTNENNLGLTKSGVGNLTLGGVNTYAGNTVVNAGTLTLADNARLTFVIQNASSNTITGAGTASLAGDFAIDTSAVTATSGTWIIENVSTLTGAYGGTFQVVDTSGTPWTDAGSDTWTKPAGGGNQWKFIETTGTLTLAPIISDPYVGWAGPSGYNLTEGKFGDDDKDGTSNILEFATNADPTDPASGARVFPWLHTDGGDTYLTYTIAVRKDAVFAVVDTTKQRADKDGVRYTVEATSDLSIWSEPVTELDETTSGDVQTAITPILPALDADWTYHTFRTDDDTATDSNDFIRLNVQETPAP